MKTYFAVAVAVLASLAFAPTARAITTYGTAAADAALQFDPYDLTRGNKPAVIYDRPMLMAGTAVVRAPAVLEEPRTDPTPLSATLDVVDAPRVLEGPYLSGLKASFIVTLRTPGKKSVTVRYRTVNGTARSGIEYASKSGTLTFGPGRWTQIVNVDVLNDDLKVTTNVPGPRRFYLEIFNPVGAKIGRSRGSADIAENGKKNVGVTVVNALPVYEKGTVNASFTVALNHASPKVVKVRYRTIDGTATAPSDYGSRTGTLTFQPGQTIKSVSVPVFDNSGKNEKIVETFFLELYDPQNAVLLRKQGTAEIAEFSNGIK